MRFSLAIALGLVVPFATLIAISVGSGKAVQSSPIELRLVGISNRSAQGRPAVFVITMMNRSSK